MALITVEPPRLTAIELGWKLREAGYEADKLEELSRTLGVDLLEILAGWGPVLAIILAPPKTSLWKRFLAWRK